MHLDTFDARLLAELQRNNRKTSAALSDTVHLSPAACLRRADRLRRHGVIRADVSVVQPEKVGVGVQALVRVTLQQKQPETIAAFEAAMLAADEVISCWQVTGGFDYGLVVVARDIAMYEAFVRVMLVENPVVRTHEASIVLNAVKSGAPLPVYLAALEGA
ncbi:Lrp/AsnC family transcriptional regulator [Caenispirillum salinarum]